MTDPRVRAGHDSMQAGFGKVDITPDFDGEKSFAILDAIYIRAVHLRWPGGQVTLLAADLFALDEIFLRRVAQALTERGIDPRWILPGACHLGTGPTLFQHYVNQPTEALKQFHEDERYVQAAVAAIWLACDDLAPAEIGVGAAEAEQGLQYNRRAHDNAGNLRMVSLTEFPTPPGDLTYDGVDRQVGVIRIERVGKRPVAVVNFGCHALSLWDQRGNISGDYPGRMAAILGEQGIDALFFQGALGNVHPVRQPPDPCEHIAVSLAATVRAVFDDICVAATAPRLLDRTVEVERQPTMPPAQARQLWEQRPAHEEGLARYQYWLAEQFHGSTVAPVTLRAIVFDDAVILHMPGEPFVETAFAVRQGSSVPVLLLANPCPELGYLPTAEARVEGGDEPLFAPLADSSEAAIRQAAIDLLAESRDVETAG